MTEIWTVLVAYLTLSDVGFNSYGQLYEYHFSW